VPCSSATWEGGCRHLVNAHWAALMRTIRVAAEPRSPTPQVAAQDPELPGTVRPARRVARFSPAGSRMACVLPKIAVPPPQPAGQIGERLAFPQLGRAHQGLLPRVQLQIVGVSRDSGSAAR
jgi:hypothetical protein